MIAVDLRCENLVAPRGIDVARPRLSWRLQEGEGDLLQGAYCLQVASERGLLLRDLPDLWDSGKIASPESQNVRYDGRPLRSREECHWRVEIWNARNEIAGWSEPQTWSMGLLNSTDWLARWVGRKGISHENADSPVLPAPLFRKEFALRGRPRRALAYFCGLGFGELYLNGSRVGEGVLDPVFTPYDRRSLYQVHDVSALLQKGSNVAGIMVGNGFYNAHEPSPWKTRHAPWTDYPKALLQLEIEFEDGAREMVLSGREWKISDGPIRHDGMRSGEIYDARQEIPGWLEAGFDDSSWAAAGEVAPPGGKLRAQLMPSCHVDAVIPPVSRKNLGKGTVLYDFGENLVGWINVRLQGERGQAVTFRYAERLDEKGQFDQAHISKYSPGIEFQTDRYTMRGSAPECWAPRFTYHGFRYVLVEGLGEGTELQEIVACAVYTRFRSVGRFECSDPVLSELHTCTLRSFRSNFVGIPTDCPHREKNGWTGDAHLAVETGLLNYDASAAYRTWIDSFPEVQRPSGQLPGIVPTGSWGYNWGSGPAWDSAFILIPWAIYLHTGDLSAFEKHYDAMVRYVDYCAARAHGHILDFGLGDWCHPFPKRMPPVEVTSTAYFYTDCRVLEQVGQLIGREGEARRLGKRADQIRDAFWNCFHRGEGQIANGEQTSQGCALYHELVPEEHRDAVMARLVRAVKEKNGSLDFGILGAKYVPRMLAEAGEVDLALQMITRPDFPSWGHWLTLGATTLWEDWVGNSSENHIMFGDISAWMYRYLGGLRPEVENPGFRRFQIRPICPQRLDSVRMEHMSPHGLIRCAWKKVFHRLDIEVEVPPNTQAQLILPEAYSREMPLEGESFSNRSMSGISHPLELSSGVHRFQLYHPHEPVLIAHENGAALNPVKAP